MTAAGPAGQRSILGITFQNPILLAAGTAGFGRELAGTVELDPTASAVLGVDPFDELNVTEAKQATQAVLQRESGATAPHALDAPNVMVETPELVARELARAVSGSHEPRAWAAALLSLVRPGDYAAILAYLHATPVRHEKLQRLRHVARGATRAATTLGYGPRFLHSTGQYHKGGPPTGLFIQLTADPAVDLPVPGEAYSLATLVAAQAVQEIHMNFVGKKLETVQERSYFLQPFN